MLISTTNTNSTVQIHGQDSNGKWTQRAVINNDYLWVTAIFSPDSRNVLITDHKGARCAQTVTIYGRNLNGDWGQRAIIHNDRDWVTAIFSPDSRNVLITDNNKAAQIYEQDSSGDTWTKTAIIGPDKIALLSSFSADGRHVAITHQDRSIGIYGQDLNGQWPQKILINNDEADKGVYPIGTRTIFSNDGHFVMIICDGEKAVKICGQSSSGEWTEKATIQHQDRILSMTFSSDSGHVLTSSNTGAVQIYSKMANDEWIEKATIQYSNNPPLFGCNTVSATLSADNRHMLTFDLAHPRIKIYRWTPDEEWIESFIIHLAANTFIRGGTFSADGSHVIIVTNDIVKIYGINSTDDTWYEKASIEHIGVIKASMSANGGHIVTVNSDHSIAKIWRLSLEKNIPSPFLPVKK